MEKERPACMCSCHKPGIGSNGECCDCHNQYNYDSYKNAEIKSYCPSCSCSVIQKRYFSIPGRDYVEFRCAECKTVITTADTPWFNTPMLTDKEKGFILDVLNRISELEKLGTDHNLRLIHKAVEAHIEGFDKRLRKKEELIEVLRTFYAEYGHRLKVIEDVVTPEVDGCPSAQSLFQSVKQLSKENEKLKNRMKHLERQVSNAIPKIACSIPDVVIEENPEEIDVMGRLTRLEQLYKKTISEWIVRTRELEWAHEIKEAPQDGSVNPTVVAQETAHEAIMKHINEVKSAIEHLQKENAMRQDTIACIDRAYDESHLAIEKRLEKLERNPSSYDAVLVKKLKDIEMTITQLLERTAFLENLNTCPVCKPGILNEELAQVAIQQGKELICPYCKGEGKHSADFEGGLKIKSPCKACDGKGFVWG